jgi:hypothetical protein
MSVETPDNSVNDEQNEISSPLSRPTEEDDNSTESEGNPDWDRDTLVQDIRHTSSHGDLVGISNEESETYTTTARSESSSSRALIPLTMTPQRGTASSHIPLSLSVAQLDQVDSEYLRILSSVVTAARRAVFPSRGIFDMEALARSLPAVLPENNGEYFGLRSSEKIERDKKIGAAGELYVSNLRCLINTKREAKANCRCLRSCLV